MPISSLWEALCSQNEARDLKVGDFPLWIPPPPGKRVPKKCQMVPGAGAPSRPKTGVLKGSFGFAGSRCFGSFCEVTPREVGLS